MMRCSCGSYAINQLAHGREPGIDLDLCDVCYWRKRAQPAQQGVDLLLLPDDLEALKRLADLFSDGEGWDLPKDTMSRLAEIGVIRRMIGNHYAITSFGRHCLDRGRPLPLRTWEEYCEAARVASTQHQQDGGKA